MNELKAIGKFLLAFAVSLPFAGLPVGCVLLSQPSDNTHAFFIITAIAAAALALWFLCFED